MRISDWSSDVCSSDLGNRGAATAAEQRSLRRRPGGRWQAEEGARGGGGVRGGGGDAFAAVARQLFDDVRQERRLVATNLWLRRQRVRQRSDGALVGKECVRQVIFDGLLYHRKKKRKHP